MPPTPDILCVMNLPPEPAGHGGSQRAWHLMQALRPHGRLHFVLLHSPQHQDCVRASLAGIAPHVASIARIPVPEWNVSEDRALGIVHPWLVDIARAGSHAAPRLSRDSLARIAAQLALRQPDWLLAARLGPAAIMHDMVAAGLVSARLRLVDFDDVLSHFRTRQIAQEGRDMGRQWRLAARLDAALLTRVERRIARSWHGISVSSFREVEALRRHAAGLPIRRVPNVVDCNLLPPRQADARFRVLFVGNLAFSPNRHGLLLFLREAWPALRRERPAVELDIVGLDPPPEIAAFAGTQGIALHANVPSVEPFYAAADAVIAPIFFGSGTRVKILEAAALGRPVIATALGAEGLEFVPGQHFLHAETMPEFAAQLSRLAGDARLGAQLVQAARAHQLAQFSPRAASAALADWVEACRIYAAGAAPHAPRSQPRNKWFARRHARNTTREAA